MHKTRISGKKNSSNNYSFIFTILHLKLVYTAETLLILRHCFVSLGLQNPNYGSSLAFISLNVFVVLFFQISTFCFIYSPEWLYKNYDSMTNFSRLHRITIQWIETRHLQYLDSSLNLFIDKFQHFRIIAEMFAFENVIDPSKYRVL